MLDTATGKLKRAIDLPCSWIRKPSFSADGSLLTLPDQNAAAIFE